MRHPRPTFDTRVVGPTSIQHVRTTTADLPSAHRVATAKTWMRCSSDLDTHQFRSRVVHQWMTADASISLNAATSLDRSVRVARFATDFIPFRMKGHRIVTTPQVRFPRRSLALEDDEGGALNPSTSLLKEETMQVGTTYVIHVPPGWLLAGKCHSLEQETVVFEDAVYIENVSNGVSPVAMRQAKDLNGWSATWWIGRLEVRRDAILLAIDLAPHLSTRQFAPQAKALERSK